MTKYKYQAVASAAVFGNLTTVHKAKARVARLRETADDDSLEARAEVERVLVLPHGGRRYWRWRNGHWSQDNHYEPKWSDLERWGAVPP